MSNETYSQSEFENGLKCEHLGIKAEDMSRLELIAFIGMLDDLYTNKCVEVQRFYG